MKITAKMLLAIAERIAATHPIEAIQLRQIARGLQP